MLIRVVDLETTGFEAPEHAPCEVAWVDLQHEGIDLSGAPINWRVDAGSMTELLCDPARPIPPETSAVHHILDEDVKGLRFWPEAIDTCIGEGIFAADVFAAHNAKFERQWLTDERTGGKPWVCTYKGALRVWPEAPGHSNQALRYWLKPEGLDRSVAHAAHRAGPDAYVTAFLLRELLKRASLHDLIKWSSEPALLPRVPIGQQKGAAWADVDVGFLKWILARDFNEDILHSAHTELERRRDEWRREHATANAST